MANPQPNDPHGVIAHDIQENLLIRNFTKQQLKIIYLVIRLSWGCGAKGWQYSSYKDFDVIDLYKGDVAKNLRFLCDSKVISWNKRYKLIVFNKNYDTWAIPVITGMSMKELVRRSLKNANIVTNLVTVLQKSEQSYQNTNEVSETLTRKLVKHEQSYQNTNKKVSETLTKALVKHEHFEAGTPSPDDVIGAPKESLKKSLNKEAIAAIVNHFKNLTNRNIDSDDENLKQILDSGLDVEVIKNIMTSKCKDYERRNKGKKIKSMTYFFGPVEDEVNRINNKGSNGTSSNRGGFEQRQYTDEFYDNLYEKFEEE
jgi:hypothetical protein